MHLKVTTASTFGNVEDSRNNAMHVVILCSYLKTPTTYNLCFIQVMSLKIEAVQSYSTPFVLQLNYIQLVQSKEWVFVS
jgi:hypothetical protein